MIHSSASQPSHSRLQCKALCDRKYFLRYISGLEPKQAFAPAFAGSCGHIGLEEFHRSGVAEQAISKAMAAWGSKRFHGEDWTFLTPGHLECILRNYTESKHTQDWKVVRLRMSDLKQEHLIATDVAVDDAGYLQLAEASFVVDVPGLGGVNIRPDLLLETASGLKVADHKFKMGWLGDKVYKEAKHGHQLRLYALTLSVLLGQPILQGMVNAIYAGEKASNPAFKGKRFEVYGFDYSPDNLVETKAWYRVHRQRMLQMEQEFSMADELEAPQHAGEHCGYCDYSVLCDAPPGIRPGLVKLHYSRKEPKAA